MSTTSSTLTSDLAAIHRLCGRLSARAEVQAGNSAKLDDIAAQLDALLDQIDRTGFATHTAPDGSTHHSIVLAAHPVESIGNLYVDGVELPTPAAPEHSAVPLTTDVLLSLIPGTWSNDEQQEAILALLQARPATVEEAETIARRTRYRLQHAARRANAERMREGFEPVADDMDPDHSDADFVYDLMARWLSGMGLAVLIHRYIDGYSVEETAERLKVAPRTVKRHTREALDTLRAKARTASFRARFVRT